MDLRLQVGRKRRLGSLTRRRKDCPRIAVFYQPVSQQWYASWYPYSTPMAHRYGGRGRDRGREASIVRRDADRSISVAVSNRRRSVDCSLTMPLVIASSAAIAVPDDDVLTRIGELLAVFLLARRQCSHLDLCLVSSLQRLRSS